MNSRCLVLPAVLVAMYAVVKPPATTDDPLRESLVGTWQHVHPPRRDAPTVEFTRGGQMVIRFPESAGILGPMTGRYWLQGDVFRSRIDGGGGPDEYIRESRSVIESVTADELRIKSVTRLRYTPEAARHQAYRRRVPIETLLAEVREEQYLGVFRRVK